MTETEPDTGFWRLLNAPCRDMAALISAAQDRNLPWPQRVAVTLHLSYCKACRRYRRQIRLIRETLREFVSDLESAEVLSGPALGPEARERIQRRLTP